MDQIYLYGSISRIPLYNCSEKTSDDWSKDTGQSRPVTGSLQIIYGISVDLLYIPIALIMLEKDMFKTSCFKIMLLLAVIDFLIISVNSVLTGFLAIRGAVYCTHPELIYLSGSVVLALWCSSCFTSLLLVSNRLLKMTRETLENNIFGGTRTFMVLAVPLIYGVCFLFTPPLLYNSRRGAWFFDPMIFPDLSPEYENAPHAVNNFLIVAITCLLYIPLTFVIRANLNTVNSQSKFQSTRIQVYLQSTLICAANQICAIIYVVMNLMPVSPSVEMLGQFLWQFIHGAPAFIYLLLNQMIQRRFLAKFRALNLVGKKASLSNTNDFSMKRRKETSNTIA